MVAQFSRTLDQLPESTQRVVDALRHGLLAILEHDLAAVWLYGGCLFTPKALDIDLHVLLRREPSEEAQREVSDLQAAVSSATAWVDELDAWYILLDDARRREPPANLRNPAQHDEHWSLHRAHWLAGACIVVHGLSPRELVQPPRWDELEATLRSELQNGALEGGGEGRACSPYWTLQLCRVLASLETRNVVRSKLDSGDWALGRLPEQAHEIIAAAMRYYNRTIEEDDVSAISRLYPSFYALIRPLIDGADR